MLGIKIIERVTTIFETFVDKIIKDKDQAAQLKHSIKMALIAHEAEISAMGKEVILAEANGSWLQRSWRPCLMFVFMALMVNNYMIAPYVQAFGGAAVFVDFPAPMWALMTVGVGGYVGGRSIEKKTEIEQISKLKGKNDET